MRERPLDARGTSHTYLLEEGVWKADGTLCDTEGRTLTVSGKTTITHQGGIWISDGYLKASKGRGVETRNTSIVTPFRNGGETTTWKSMDPSLGALSGRLVIVGDSIISTFSSADGIHAGCEFVLKVSGKEYLSRGYVLKDGQKLSSWSASLKRESHPERKR